MHENSFVSMDGGSLFKKLFRLFMYRVYSIFVKYI